MFAPIALSWSLTAQSCSKRVWQSRLSLSQPQAFITAPARFGMTGMKPPISLRRNRRLNHMQVRCLNRLLFEPEEVVPSSQSSCLLYLAKSDKRVTHIKKILKLENGQSLRIGVVDAGKEEDAVLEWQDDGSLKLQISQSAEQLCAPYTADKIPRIDLLIALPRPPNLGDFLGIAAQMGVANVIFCNANKVQQDYFGSHLLRPPMSKMRQALKEGLEQAGETYLPKPYRRILVGVGPEAGWQDPYELELLGEHGFQGISLGPRTYRTEVALISLLALANERLEMVTSRGVRSDDKS
ncbi:hypothetical protein GUITHDRAFT_122815 [Guillardia theta CCMP2712]|uniref:16S rRNA (uracil(1498)-N(3))-methyltransferase n=1 Tax=Guillardia theta (strain CCMP2712) TaxID=905079 RepID=L1I416_GUITC|nr:hypothetical protein GUITHDRAFT_122815 [Guillardia theta CCMP2712]EKX30981.1 hypothetical protein GUITHDRAFT_122815 [Guillardia theta CCMP2712]|eukprot:XP_005817961.1 hypothetical protein GUITHDRAFT_122815 [Guillardia theta CCMP2712]